MLLCRVLQVALWNLEALLDERYVALKGPICLSSL